MNESCEVLPLLRLASRAAIRENPRSVKQMLSARQEYQLELQNAMSTAIRSTKNILAAVCILQSLNYPLKQGDSVIKLLDQAIYELKSIGEISVNLNPTKFFKSVFEMNDQQSTDFASVESFSGEVLQSPRFRPWLLNSTIRIILNCKRSVILEQICFVVNRIQMLTFQADFNSQKVIQLDPIQIHLRKRPSNDAAASINCIEKRVSINIDNQPMSNLYATLRQIISKKLMKGQSDNKLVDKNGNYRLRFNPQTKEYQRTLLKDYQAEDMKGSCDFVDRLNHSIKELNTQKESTDLLASLHQNLWFVLTIVLAILLGLVLSLMIDDSRNHWLLQLIVFSPIVFSCVKMLKLPVYSHRTFKYAIRELLRLHYEQNESGEVYEMEPGGYDILILEKTQLS